LHPGDAGFAGGRLTPRHSPTRKEVRELLARLLCEVAKIPSERILEGATVDHELRMESVAFIEIQVAIEDEYEIELDPVYLIELNEFGAIVDHIVECANQNDI
jgi:acyl carrier protein